MCSSDLQGGFELHYQPLVAVNGTALHKAEALLRWQHSRWGVVAPGVFIPVAEQSDLIIEITDWVLHTAAKQVKHWRETLDATFQISVNIPPAYLNLCVRETEEMLRRLQALKLPKGALVLEITEGAVLEVTEELLCVTDQLRNLGFELALDDFGVGYSNFGQLDKLKLDHLKLDKTFIQAIDERPER